MARALAARGFRIAAHYHSSARGAQDFASEANAEHEGSVALFQADLTDPEAAISLPSEVVTEMGRLDLLVNSAAVMKHASFEETTPAIWDQVIDLNLRGVFFVSQGATEHLRATRGKIINLIDTSAYDPWPGYLAHSIGKAGVEALTRALAVDLGPEVAVNAIAPGAVLVPEDFSDEQREELKRKAPLERLGSPQDVIQALEYLVNADFVTGATLVVDGGWSVRPRR